MNPIAIELGPFSIRWYAIFIISGLALAVLLSMREAKYKNWDPDLILDFVLWGFPIGIIGARIYYVLFQWSYYQEHPEEMLAIWNGGIAIYGGLIAGGLFLIWYARRNLLSPWTFLDIVAPGVLIAQSLGRWGNFANQEAYGAVVENLDYLPQFIQNQMFIEGAYRQPTFLMESIWTALGFLILISLRHRPRLFKEGELALFYLIWYGTGRFFIEGLRTDSLLLGPLRVSQILSLILVILGFSLWIYRRKNRNLAWYQAEK
ncbi:prolipoprotein diacylglyceryl transferase [Streptococcus sp. 121]|uniref:prolipoprotein diacylglyceryl transferase n=1 Tax=Streptococcus sp. 121 TaxID=2797637 RepID=UPI0018F062A3|nr:prolipoprotein diacylglyceryl transferase [Streptococcus sp. 121]MBJ6746072.1 prolipoprotein diacylglyceryl transferase [Streptococcus sp. 121]